MTSIKSIGVLLTCLLAASVCVNAVRMTGKPVVKARAILTGNTTVGGVLELAQYRDGTLRIKGRITGLTPGKHGFHVHKYGDVFTEGCYSAGPHYNPLKVLHGPREASILRRHVGDLGNIVANEKGVAEIDIKDRIVSLTGPFSIVGRAFVVHSNEDDLGAFPDDPGSVTTGNSGARLACGIVFIVP